MGAVFSNDRFSNILSHGILHVAVVLVSMLSHSLRRRTRCASCRIGRQQRLERWVDRGVAAGVGGAGADQEALLPFALASDGVRAYQTLCDWKPDAGAAFQGNW